MDDMTELRQRPRKMLIADDDPAILRLLADRCGHMGFQVETAMNGAQLLVKVRNNHPDILVVDVKMPMLDGLSVCTHLLDPGRKPLEVIVVTGSDDPETPERCESLGLFFGRKGPDFWRSLEAALIEIYPDLASKMEALPAASWGAAVPRRPRVLVVDDDPDIGIFFSSRLGKYGVDTLYAGDAMRGFRIAGKEKPSVIICDHLMPHGDALFLLHRLRAAPATANIPVFVISAGGLDESDEQILRREIQGRPGALHVFRKSFDTSELFTALQKFCGFEEPPVLPRPQTAPPRAASRERMRRAAIVF
jgi:CheY-like chemotaxis protein